MVQLISFLLHKHEALGLDTQTLIYDQALHTPLIPVPGSQKHENACSFLNRLTRKISRFSMRPCLNQ